MTMAFDTLAAAKALKSAGFDEARADAIVGVIRQSAPLEELVTKDYLKGELEKLEGRLKLFVAYTMLGSAAAIVLAQVILKFLGLAS